VREPPQTGSPQEAAHSGAGENGRQRPGYKGASA